MQSKTIFFIGALLLIVGVIFAANYNKTNITSSPETTSQTVLPDDQVTEKKKIDFAIAVLHALNFYYLTTQSEINESSSYIEMTASLLTSSNNLEKGSLSISEYVNDPNEFISVAATGMDLGANTVIKANNELVSFIRNTNLDDPASFREAEYQIANYLANQKEGYTLIATSAPWMTALMYEPAESENPSGKIPYTISNEGRQRILKEIERLFGDDLRIYQQDVASEAESYNSILFSVDAIYNNLASDTYEEGS